MRRIITDPEILAGKPVLEGTRISVEQVLGLLSHGMTHEQVAETYPEITVDDVKAVLRYAVAALRNDVVIDVARTAGA